MLLPYYTTVVLRIDIDDYWDQATYSDADTYFTARGIATWTGTNDAKTQALQRAWDYMATLPWLDSIFAMTQPDDITNAHILLAHEELKESGVLTPALTRDDYVSEKNLAGAIVKKYAALAPPWKRFRGVEMLLAPYLMAAGTIEMRRG